MIERVIKEYEQEYKNFQYVALALEIASPNNAKYEVGETYLDYGQGWKWTTIIRRGYKECQVLNPREWEKIWLATKLEKLNQIVEEIRNGTYFGDK